MPQIKLNCDLGETDQLQPDGPEHQAMPHIHMANIACGFHAGNRQTMLATLALAKQHKVMVGAHPSYPDRENFGRVSMALSQADVCDAVFQQLDTLTALAEVQGTNVAYVKPHGALYHDILHSETIRRGVFQAVAACNATMPVLVLANVNRTALEQSAAEFGLQLWYEAFADRRYCANGQLQPRTIEGAVLTDAHSIVAQASAIAQGKPLQTATGESLVLEADSLCVHGDNPDAIATIKAIRAAISP